MNHQTTGHKALSPPRPSPWILAVATLLVAGVAFFTHSLDSGEHPESSIADARMSDAETVSEVMQGSGIVAEPLVQVVNVYREPRGLESEVWYSEFIAEATVAELGPAEFNTVSGQMPALAPGDDPSEDVDDGWSIYTPAKFDIVHVYKGDPITSHVVAELMGGEMPDGNRLIVEGGLSYSQLQVDQTVMLFSTREHEPVMYSDLHFLRRGSIRTLDLIAQGYHPEFRQIGAVCIYSGDQADCIEDMFSMQVADLRSQIDALVP